jgi:hypothetical protein
MFTSFVIVRECKTPGRGAPPSKKIDIERQAIRKQKKNNRDFNSKKKLNK